MKDRIKHTAGEIKSSDFPDDDSTLPSEVGPTFSQRWTENINTLRSPIQKILLWLSGVATRSPKLTISATVLTSFALLAIGIFTNFHLEIDMDEMWTPYQSRPREHMAWRDRIFPKAPSQFVLLFQSSNPNTTISKRNLQYTFELYDAITALPSYDAACNNECRTNGATKFWSDNYAALNATSDVVAAMSREFFPDLTPVYTPEIFGQVERDASGRILSTAGYAQYIKFTHSDAVRDFEGDALDVVFEFQEQRLKNVDLSVYVYAERSLGDEFGRAIINDIPLVPAVFVIMGIFTAGVFSSRHAVHSRSLLGFLAVVSVMLSIMAGYGLMFIIGVPMTSATQILPFVFFGVGLDDAFIISGEYLRQHKHTDIPERIRATIQEIGLSIFLTTVTSCLAFSVGTLSSVPTIYWLCVYAVPTMVFILLWQLTFFVACIVLDERRVQEKHRDCFRCCVPVPANSDPPTPTTERFMGWYAKILTQPLVMFLVIAGFTGLAVVCGFQLQDFEQEFKFHDVLPDGSYIADFFEVLDKMGNQSAVLPDIYFRDVDQSNPAVRTQMRLYLDDLVTIDAFEESPNLCWVNEFDEYINANPDLRTFRAQLDSFLANPVNNFLYASDIVRDHDGGIYASRCKMPMSNIDLEDIQGLMAALQDQRDVSHRQHMNQGRHDFRFFTYEESYNLWEFYTATNSEIVLTVISSVVAVTLVTLLLVPHWSAALFVLPLIIMLYVDLMGVMKWCGVKINPPSYFTLVISVGLLVDFILHVLLRFYESPGDRVQKASHMLKTMGSSILIGGITTFLGTLPLAFSTSDIFATVFIGFCALVVLGVSHGLIFLPVLLLLVGPEEQISSSATTKKCHTKAALKKSVVMPVFVDHEEVFA